MVYVEQGLGQGRVEAPSDSIRYDAGVMNALRVKAPYTLLADTDFPTEISMIHYTDDRNQITETSQALHE